jgi:cell division protein FtsL
MQNYQFELKESHQRLKDERKIFYIIIASAVIIILLVLLFLYNNSIKYRQQKKITQLEFEKNKATI